MLTSKKVVLFLILLVMLVGAGGLVMEPAAAQDLWERQAGMGTDPGEAGESFGYSSEPESLSETVARIIRVFLTLLGIIFLILMILAGYRWMTAGGNEDKVSESKKQIRNAVIGLIIIMMAYSISYLVTEILYNATVD